MFKAIVVMYNVLYCAATLLLASVRYFEARQKGPKLQVMSTIIFHSESLTNNELSVSFGSLKIIRNDLNISHYDVEVDGLNDDGSEF